MVGPPSQVSVGPSPALAVGWFGHRSVAPPAAPVCWALVGSLLRRSVALGSCAPYPVGSSLVDSYGFVVQAPGVFLASFLGFFPLASGGYGWLGVVVASISCRVPYLRLALCSSACVSLGGCPSSLRSALRVRTGFLFALVCVWASPVSSSYVFLQDVVTRWVNSVFLSLLIANEGLHWSGLSLSFASGLSSPGLSCCFTMCLRCADWLSLWLCVHNLFGL